MADERFGNEELLWLTLMMGFGFVLGILFGGLFLRLPGALLGAALGPMIVYRAFKIRSRRADPPDSPPPAPRRRHER